MSATGDASVEARLFVVRSLNARAQSVAEMERKLAARGVPPDVARDAVQEALAARYLDDAELAGQLARGMRERGYGRLRAEHKLRIRGISATTAAVALGTAYADGEEATARAALRSRPLDNAACRRKAVAHLMRRGFTSAIAGAAVRAELAERSGRGTP